MDLFDSDDTCSVSSFFSMRSERPRMDEVHVHKDLMLDQSLDALYEKRSSTREKALASIVEAFKSDLQHEFLQKNFSTLLHQCLHCIKKGSTKESSLASHVIGLIALTVGLGNQAQEILEESATPLSQALKSGREALRISSILECLAVITFVGGANAEQTERSMQIIWQMIHPKLVSNVSAGEALALLFETGTLEKFDTEAKGSDNGSVEVGSVSEEALIKMHKLISKVIINLVTSLQRQVVKVVLTKISTHNEVCSKILLNFLRVELHLKPLQRLEEPIYRRQRGAR
ncbi:unnamed protein product [Eruca vesicaria subsp. sativa]|uniref:Interferon-related developmental regulator N-terminal domain-containing protein n=1 Tax=Eruca vesicaria subsp. sativa TaxID=29727 RepID=A0ABC8JYW2_ERUVS|nr:unnamed protein product [Eruca vesicaria subsp. sativa]